MKQLLVDLMALDCYGFKVSFGHNPRTGEIEAELFFYDEYGDDLSQETILQNDRIRQALGNIQNRRIARGKVEKAG